MTITVHLLKLHLVFVTLHVVTLAVYVYYNLHTYENDNQISTEGMCSEISCNLPRFGLCINSKQGSSQCDLLKSRSVRKWPNSSNIGSILSGFCKWNKILPVLEVVLIVDNQVDEQFGELTDNNNVVIAKYRKTFETKNASSQTLFFLTYHGFFPRKYIKVSLELNYAWNYSEQCKKDPLASGCNCQPKCSPNEVCAYNNTNVHKQFQCISKLKKQKMCKKTCFYPAVCINGICSCPYPFEIIKYVCRCTDDCVRRLGISVCKTKEVCLDKNCLPRKSLENKSSITDQFSKSQGNICNNCSTCGIKASCIESNWECKCNSGFKGNPYGECNSDCRASCSKSKGFVCDNGRCICGESLYLSQNGGTCQCKLGFLPDLKGGCKQELCKDACHIGAVCHNRKCVCMEPYEGDGRECHCRRGYSRKIGWQWSCRLDECSPDCDANAICYEGNCYCKPPYEGNGLRCKCGPGYHTKGSSTCFKIPKCPKTCPKHSSCDKTKGKCVCNHPYKGEPSYKCHCPNNDFFYEDKLKRCVGVCSPLCHKNSTCINSTCNCNPPFLGNGITCSLCQKSCAENAKCDWLLQACMCDAGFYGNGSERCWPLCEPPCHENANCINGRCVCRHENSRGDGITTCVNCELCGEDATCTVDGCFCREGLLGDPYVRCIDPICKEECIRGATCFNGECTCVYPLEKLENECKCSAGYHMNSSTNKCHVDKCHPECVEHAQCVKRQCQCVQPYTGKGTIRCECLKVFHDRNKTRVCIARAECNGCHEKATCVNHKCKCQEGYSGNGFDFCFRCGRCPSHLDSVCTPSQMRCNCVEGLEGNPYEKCSKPRLRCKTTIILFVVFDAIMIIANCGVRVCRSQLQVDEMDAPYYVVMMSEFKPNTRTSGFKLRERRTWSSSQSSGGSELYSVHDGDLVHLVPANQQSEPSSTDTELANLLRGGGKRIIDNRGAVPKILSSSSSD